MFFFFSSYRVHGTAFDEGKGYLALLLMQLDIPSIL